MQGSTRPDPASVFDRLTLWASEPATFRMLSVALMVPLLALYLPGSIWTGNEENYFQLAYRRVAPDAFSPWSAVFDHSNGRFIGEYLYGGLVKLLGYESAHLVARVGTAVLYATSLAAMFASVRLSIIESVAVVLAFHMLGEQILGGEWLFNGSEPKTIAYALVFFAVALANHGRWRAAFVVSAGATWLHFLAGGFWSLALGLCAAWQLRSDWRVAARALAIYVVLILPLLAIITHDQMLATSTLPLPAGDLSPLDTDQIYAWRNAHHVSPFVNPEIFPRWRRGMVDLGYAIVVLVVVWRRRTASALLLPLAAIGLAELVLALIISYLDQERLALAKLYLFRPSSVTLLIMLGVAVIAIRSAVTPRVSALAVLSLVVALAVFQAVRLEYRRDRIIPDPPMNVPHQAELIEAVQSSSDAGEVVVLDPELDPTLRGIRLNRLIGRPTVVAWKFVPTAPQDIERWYTLMRWREHLFDSGCARGTEGVPVKLLVTASRLARDRTANCGPVIWQRDDMAVVRVGR